MSLVGVQMGPGLAEEVDVTGEAGVGSEEERRAIGPVAQMHRGSLKQEKTQDVDIGRGRRDMLCWLARQLTPPEGDQGNGVYTMGELPE